ncbi:hypothetical protein LX81_00261 [Palleronia aestuarii]|uniref:Methyltransferase n=1 Tax=Palleronia aestuarii TaxID=568105 RepID=A0A2W7QD70_9RHOB|nr:hypothetical protein [Palleronia aestuarii]PZX19799.1 hypothetical protein LX81_00261 [Palleronia aestuarii]
MIGRQNRSSAVMQQRAPAPDALDDFPTPPWATRALCKFLEREGFDLGQQSCWEPACNRGHMAQPLAEHFAEITATDIFDYGWPGMDGVCDFLGAPGLHERRPGWVITNPPFKVADQFIQRGLDVAREGVAVFVRTSFVEGAERYRTLFSVRPETFVLPFVERVPIWRGVLLDPDVPVWDAETHALRKPSTATSYAWLVWTKDKVVGADRTIFERIPPCRARLTRPGDYPPLPDHLRPPEGGLMGMLQ